MWSKFRHQTQILQIAAGATGLFFGILLNVLSNVIDEAGWPIKGALFLLFLLSLVTYVWLWRQQPDYITLIVPSPETLRLPEEKKRVARRGVVVAMSLYNPQEPNLARQELPEKWQEWAATADFRALDFPRSNIAPLIEAVTTHASCLTHCWLIGTVGTDSKAPGSNQYIPALIEYLRHEHGLQCEFHYGDTLQLSLDDDALVFDKTTKLMYTIFNQAMALGLQPKDLIVDCTSGIRSIALGAILSSLDAERDIQLIGTHYLPNGKPFGGLLPMIFHFEPVIKQRS